MFCVFFCKQKTAYEMRISDWSSDVCSSDLAAALGTQERDGAGDIFDFTEPRVRCHLDIDALEQRIFEPAGDHRRHRHARRDVVAADADRKSTRLNSSH